MIAEILQVLRDLAVLIKLRSRAELENQPILRQLLLRQLDSLVDEPSGIQPWLSPI